MVDFIYYHNKAINKTTRMKDDNAESGNDPVYF